MNKQDFLFSVLADDSVSFADLEEIWELLDGKSTFDALPAWQKTLINKDLSFLKEHSGRARLYSFEEAYKIYAEIYCSACSLLHPNGKASKPLPLFIVDTLPKPYNERPWKAMCVDYNLGGFKSIDEGIYYKSDFLIQGMFEIMISHEITHYLISCHSKDEKQPFTSLFEEGICDFISYYVVLHTDKSLYSTVKSYIIHNRVGATKKTLARKRYYQMSKLVFYLVLQNGLDYLTDMLREGRKSLSLRKFEPLQREHVKNETLLLLETLFAESDSFVILPIDEYAVFSYTARACTCTISDVSKALSMPEGVLVPYLDKMQQDGLLSTNSNTVYNYNIGILGEFYYTV